jgi:hypothetical protein
MPHHLETSEMKKAKIYKKSQSGISLVTYTMDNQDEGERFIKKLLTRGLIATAEIET